MHVSRRMELGFDATVRARLCCISSALFIQSGLPRSRMLQTTQPRLSQCFPISCQRIRLWQTRRSGPQRKMVCSFVHSWCQRRPRESETALSHPHRPWTCEAALDKRRALNMLRSSTKLFFCPSAIARLLPFIRSFVSRLLIPYCNPSSTA